MLLALSSIWGRAILSCHLGLLDRPYQFLVGRQMTKDAMSAAPDAWTIPEAGYSVGGQYTNYLEDHPTDHHWLGSGVKFTTYIYILCIYIYILCIYIYIRKPHDIFTVTIYQ